MFFVFNYSLIPAKSDTVKGHSESIFTDYWGVGTNIG